MYVIVRMLYICCVTVVYVIVVSDETEHGFIVNMHLFTQIFW